MSKKHNPVDNFKKNCTPEYLAWYALFSGIILYFTNKK